MVQGRREPAARIQRKFKTGVGARIWEEAAKKPASRVLNCQDDTELHEAGGATEARERGGGHRCCIWWAFGGSAVCGSGAKFWSWTVIRSHCVPFGKSLNFAEHPLP